MYADNAELSGKYGDLYDLVREGKWTLDVMYEMMKAVAEPDETGAWSENATYGMAGSINIGNVERYPQNGWDIVNTAFQEGHALFYSTNASSISIFKNAEDEVVSFGVLPNPKFSESQDRYYHTVNSGNSSVLAVASTNVENVEATCYLLELLGYYGKHTPFKSINDAYYETTLKLQAVESDDDAEMLDIVFGNRIYDIYTMMPWGSSPTLGQIYGQVLTAGSNTTVSLLESKRQEIETDIQNTLNEFSKLN